MGFRVFELKMPVSYTSRELEEKIKKESRCQAISWQIIRKSLDSRRKGNIHWQLKVQVESSDLPGPPLPQDRLPPLPRIKTSKKVVIAGSGPAGIFAALYLLKSGLKVTIMERGTGVRKRASDIVRLENQGIFKADSNYSFGEGGAGTFSDGKLSSRSKHIKKEKRYILEEFIRYGAPEEILYLTHPHIGSDKLIRIAENMGQAVRKMGGDFLYESPLKDMDIKNGRVQAVCSDGLSRPLEADYCLLATGHSARDSFHLFMDKGIEFQPKNFALGVRMEHPQDLINRIQWGCCSLEGVKAAEYRLTSPAAKLPVYSFCMCPGGRVVPSAAFKNINTVNGMSLYQRSGPFANAALVAGVSPRLLEESGAPSGARGSLEWLAALEEDFYNAAGESYRAPAITIKDFLDSGEARELRASSYIPGLFPQNPARLLPPALEEALKLGLADLCRRLPGWDEGQLMGLESKTSSPIRASRNSRTSLCDGFENLFICGEASGCSGGIISSAADGLKAALAITESLR